MFTDLYEKLRELTRSCATEEELRIAWTTSFSKIDIEFQAERDRNDLSHNQIIIEFKNKGFFKGSVTSPKFKEAIDDRLYKYIKRKAKTEGLPEADYTGIATDGDHIAFCYLQNGAIRHQDLMPLSLISVTKVAKCLLTDERRALTSVNLIDDFGHNSSVGIKLMGALSNELSQHFFDTENNKIKMLFKEWQSLFGQVSGLTNEQVLKINKQLNFPAPNINDESVSGLLFVIHTYNALIMKLLGAEIVSYLDLTQYKDFCGNLASATDDTLLKILEIDIEKSKLFELAGIKGFVEEAIFSWYLDATDSGDKSNIVSALKEALVQISLYRFDDLDAARSRDVLKGFYQALVPDVLRKSLGEFYTPDWLVEQTAKSANINNWLDVRVLDPTCGSGSFLLHAIKLKRKEAENKGFTPEEVIDNVVSTVWGFDLNPLAVQAARVNFLISISDLVSKCKSKEIELPILLADSVYSPARNPLLDESIVEYRIGSKTADLLIILPSDLAFDRKKLDAVFSVMGECVDDNEEFLSVSRKIIRRKILTKTQIEEWKNSLESTYNRVLSLHRENWNGIWFRIVRNFFWSATAGEFDLIIGNPPWVRWSALPIDYRDKIKPTCENYEIFSETKFHGGNELDISGMITYTVADKWLKNNAQLIFVITQTHFQSPSSQGFRGFKINQEYHLRPIQVDDLKNLKPFPDAANKTAIASFQKTNRSMDNTYPIPYKIWSPKEGFGRVIDEHASLKDVSAGINILTYEAQPVDEINSPWAIMKPGDFARTDKIRGMSGWIKGRKGVTTDLNAIYMVEILDIDEDRNLVLIETRPNAGKKDIGVAKKFWVEPDLLYPMVKGASDFKSCYFSPRNNLYIFVPNKGITKKFLQEAEDLVENDLPKTYNYFKSYKNLLLNRSTYKNRLGKYDFYHVYNVGEYTFAPYKVIWAEQSGTFRAAVSSKKKVPLLGLRPYVPDHKVYFIDCYNKEEAFYLCGLLSCTLVKEYIESHTISIQVSNIFKHMELPRFNSKCKQSIKLAKLVENIHKIPNEEDRVKKIEKVSLLAEEIISAESRGQPA